MSSFKKYLILILICFCFPLYAAPQDEIKIYDNIFVFGDGFSDSGTLIGSFEELLKNAGQQTDHVKNDLAWELGEKVAEILQNGTRLPAPYYKNRMTNGATAIEIFHRDYSDAFKKTKAMKSGYYVELYGLIHAEQKGNNYAKYLAKAVGENSFEDYLDLEAQVQAYFKHYPTIPSPNTLYVFMIGTYDLAETTYGIMTRNYPSTVSRATRQIKNQIEALYEEGGRYFFVSNIPDLADLPKFNGHGLAESAHRASAYFNSELKSIVAELKSDYQDIIIQEFDLYQAIKDIIERYKALPNTEFREGCFKSLPAMFKEDIPLDRCVNDKGIPLENYVFFDDLHPTAAVHKQIAEKMLSVMYADQIKHYYAREGYWAGQYIIEDVDNVFWTRSNQESLKINDLFEKGYLPPAVSSKQLGLVHVGYKYKHIRTGSTGSDNRIFAFIQDPENASLFRIQGMGRAQTGLSNKKRVAELIQDYHQDRQGKLCDIDVKRIIKLTPDTSNINRIKIRVKYESQDQQRWNSTSTVNKSETRTYTARYYPDNPVIGRQERYILLDVDKETSIRDCQSTRFLGKQVEHYIANVSNRFDDEVITLFPIEIDEVLYFNPKTKFLYATLKYVIYPTKRTPLVLTTEWARYYPRPHIGIPAMIGNPIRTETKVYR